MDATGRSFEIIYVNDGSPDGTLAVLNEIFDRDTRVGVLLDLMKNSGSAAAVSAGCAAARGQHFIFMDSDLQLDPEDLPKLLAAFDEGADLANGVRAERNDPLLRRAASKVVNFALRKAYGVAAIDLGCTFKVARGELLRGLGFGPRKALNPTHLAAAAGRCANVDVTHHARRFGGSGWGYWRLISLTVDTLLGLSRGPFELLSMANLMLASLVFLRLVVALFNSGSLLSEVTHGLLLSIALMSLTLLVGIGCLVGAYVIRIHRSIEGPPLYIVRRSWKREVAVAS